MTYHCPGAVLTRRPTGRGGCMAVTMKLTLEGDFSHWPRRLRLAVDEAVIAARDSFAAGKPRSVQSATHAALFAGAIRAFVRERLARQVSIPALAWPQSGSAHCSRCDQRRLHRLVSPGPGVCLSPFAMSAQTL